MLRIYFIWVLFLIITLVICLCPLVIHCPVLDMMHAELNSTDTQFGVTVNISCLPGYRINGQTAKTVRCTGTGHWSHYNHTCLRMLHLTLMLKKFVKQHHICLIFNSGHYQK